MFIGGDAGESAAMGKIVLTGTTAAEEAAGEAAALFSFSCCNLRWCQGWGWVKIRIRFEIRARVGVRSRLGLGLRLGLRLEVGKLMSFLKTGTRH